jgi:aminoglycoside phosphotransferase (APT) family kinase protein
VGRRREPARRPPRVTAPADTPLGVVHGDFYSNNWLFDGGRLTAVVDWENTVWGPKLVDIGWLCMIYDPASWGPRRQPMLDWTPDPETLAARYAASGAEGLGQLPWFRALAGYRLACLTAHYLRLHRTGRRIDPVWEVFGDGFPAMIRRGHELLDGGTG